MKRLNPWLFFAPVLLILGSCGKPSNSANDDPVAFLKWSMDKYASAKTFHAECQWKVDYPDTEKDEPAAGRVFDYAKPNRFKVVSSQSQGMFTQTSVSDGKSLVEYGNSADTGAMTYPAPLDIATVDSMMMKHPMFGGTLLYQFFAGSSAYDSVVDSSKGKPTFGPTEKSPEGEEARIVKFTNKGTYGDVEMLIGKTTGLVYRIKYDSKGLQQALKDMGDQAPKDVKIPDFNTYEVYSKMSTDAPIPDKTFDVTLPKGVKPMEPASAPESEAPVPIGKPAPDIEVTTLEGKDVKLSSLRGHPVLIDFWATWCGPCREGLPITNKMHEEFSKKGLVVLAVSDEDKDTVAKFINENKYTFQTCLDANAAAAKVYKVTGIPTTVVVDAKGNLVAYQMGLEPEAALRESLAKAGIK